MVELYIVYANNELISNSRPNGCMADLSLSFIYQPSYGYRAKTDSNTKLVPLLA